MGRKKSRRREKKDREISGKEEGKGLEHGVGVWLIFCCFIFYCIVCVFHTRFKDI